MLKVFLEQADTSMPESLIQEQAKECMAYLVALPLKNEPEARRELLQGLLQIYAEMEGARPDTCSLKRPLEYIERMITHC